MKKVTLIIIALFIAYGCKSQQILHIVDFKLPDGSKQLNQQQVESLTLKSNNAELYPSKPMQYYEVQGVKFSFQNIHNTNKESQPTLERAKSSLLNSETLGVRSNQSATIITINNMRFLIYRYNEIRTKDNFIRFYTEWHNDYAATGLLRFDKADADKANNVLNEILSTMKFKN